MSDHQLIVGSVNSRILERNQAGINPERPYVVYLPPGYGDQPLPVLYCLASWLNSGRGMMNFVPFKRYLPELLDDLIESGRMPPCVVVCPDLLTRFGGSQYVDSDYMGSHASFVVDELIPHIEAAYNVKQGVESRGVFGISSGGFGALRFMMDFPEAFAACACHSGDMGFELTYGRDLIEISQALGRFGGDVDAYLAECDARPKTSGRDLHVHMLLGMAATYSPNPKSPWGFDLPIDWFDGRVNQAVWHRWLEHDPVVRAQRPDVGANLKSARKIYLEVGSRDQYYLQFGARQLVKVLNDKKIAHDFCEFDDNHSGLTYRFETSLPLLLAALV